MLARFSNHILVIITILCLNSVAYCGQGRRTNFLDTGPGSAGAALGGALIAKGLDASAGYYNPATLVMLPSGTFLEYAQPNIGATRSWLGISSGGPRFSMGFLWKNENLPLSSNRNAFLMSNSISDRSIPFFPKGTSVGLTLGYIQENIVGYSASSFLASVGAAYSRTIRSSEFGVGVVMRNLYFSGLQFRPEGEKEVWPVEPELGGYISKLGLKLFLSTKGQNQDDLRYGFGFAYQPVSFIEFRAGMNGHPRFGVGLEIKKIRLDYAVSMGEIKTVNAMSLSYLWGKPDIEKDYTNPLIELSARYESLPEYILSELRSTAENGNIPELHDVLRLLVVNPKSEEGWRLYTSLTGNHKLKVKFPWSKKVRREYLKFAISFANNDRGSIELGKRFLSQYPKSSVSELVKISIDRQK